jgi:hypothetical protein
MRFYGRDILSPGDIICTTYCNKLFSALLQDLSQPSLATQVAFTFAFNVKVPFPATAAGSSVW